MSDIQDKIDAYTANCTGTENLWRWLYTQKFVYTDGVKFVAETCKSYWLIDKILLLQKQPKVSSEEFQVWKLSVADRSGILTCDDGNGNQIVREVIPFTDFPIPEMTFWFEIDTLMLPCER